MNQIYGRPEKGEKGPGLFCPHWNGNLLCSIDVETTGLDPENDELLEVAIVPLKPDLTPNLNIMPFDMVLQPKYPDNFKRDQILLKGMTLAETMLHGTEAWVAEQLLEDWVEALRLPERKRIMPLGHNYTKFDMLFLKEWMTPEQYDILFHFHVRDSMEVGLYMNDVADALRMHYPFPKVDLGYMCTTLGITNHRRHRALGDAMATAELYRRLVTKVGPSFLTASKATQCSLDELEIAKEVQIAPGEFRPPWHTQHLG